MRLCGLLLIISLVLADTIVFANEILQSCIDELACDPFDHHSVHGRVGENMTQNSECGESSVPKSICDFSWTEISCHIYNSGLLNCSWSTHTLPENAQYSAYFHECKESDDNTTHELHCSTSREKGRVECHRQISISEQVMVLVNISVPHHWRILCKTFVQVNIEILEPPKNITAVIKSEALEIEWSPPTSFHNSGSHCFDYELKINNDTVMVTSNTFQYTKRNIDLTRSYSTKIRTKWNICADNQQWSDWSEIKVVGPTEKPYQLNIYVIVTIAFVLPMILLAFLLVCKFQRLSEKLFPSVPGPSVKVKMLLEKEDFTQVTPPKQGGFKVEEGTEILQVTS
ncbi:interleukin-5 receptor subunit alpha-like isoform X2 [Salminus brasiliensis]